VDYSHINIKYWVITVAGGL